MDASASPAEDPLPRTSPNISAAFTSLSSLFDDCMRDVWTPLLPDARDRLDQLFDETLGHIVEQLDASAFGVNIVIKFLDH